jgi:phage shock protein PspC (stress-responsive transcriptional regulator)
MNTDTMNPQDTDTSQIGSSQDTGQTSTGQTSTGQTSTGQTSTGQTSTGQTDPRPEPPFGYLQDRHALRRPFQGRMVTGVAEGLARYFGVDPLLVRIGFVVLTVVGGAGVPLYLAGLLLIPDEGSNQSIAASIIESLQNRNR